MGEASVHYQAPIACLQGGEGRRLLSRRGNVDNDLTRSGGWQKLADVVVHLVICGTPS